MPGSLNSKCQCSGCNPWHGDRRRDTPWTRDASYPRGHAAGAGIPFEGQRPAALKQQPCGGSLRDGGDRDSKEAFQRRTKITGRVEKNERIDIVPLLMPRSSKSKGLERLSIPSPACRNIAIVLESNGSLQEHSPAFLHETTASGKARELIHNAVQGLGNFPILANSCSDVRKNAFGGMDIMIMEGQCDPYSITQLGKAFEKLHSAQADNILILTEPSLPVIPARSGMDRKRRREILPRTTDLASKIADKVHIPSYEVIQSLPLPHVREYAALETGYTCDDFLVLAVQLSVRERLANFPGLKNRDKLTHDAMKLFSTVAHLDVATVEAAYGAYEGSLIAENAESAIRKLIAASDAMTRYAMAKVFVAHREVQHVICVSHFVHANAIRKALDAKNGNTRNA